METSDLEIGLQTVAGVIRRWLEWDRNHRRAENLTTDGDTHIMVLPVPSWPSHAQFEAWVDLFDKCVVALRTAARPDAGYAVKALEWSWEPPYSVARALGGHYAVERWGDGADDAADLTGSFIKTRQQFETIEAAKAAAQADYEKRIRSALIEQPATPGYAAGVEACRENLREAWPAFAMIREAVETLGPVGAMPAGENLDGPTFMHEAQAIVEGIQLMALSALPAPAGGAEEVTPPTKWEVGKNGWDASDEITREDR